MGIRYFYFEVCTRLLGQQLDPAAVCGNVFMHDGQANAAAAHSACRLTFATVKGLKNSLAVGFSNTAAFVVDLNQSQTRAGSQRDADQTARRRKTDRIRQQIAQRRADFFGVDFNQYRCAGAGVAVNRHLQFACTPLQLLRLNLRFHQMQQIDPLTMQLACLKCGSIEAQQVFNLAL